MSTLWRTSRRGRRGSGLVMPAFFLVLAVVLWSPPWGYHPKDHPEEPPRSSCDTPSFPREAKKGPTLMMDGVEYSCMDCHFEGEEVPETVELPLETEHTHIRLNHGRNDYCFNCHHSGSREYLTSYRNQPVPFTEVSKTCGNCHVTVYLDWEQNIHGRHTGTRDDSKRGEAEVAGCTSCHDPHSPKFKPIEPCPPPAIPERVREVVPANRVEKS